MGTAVAKKADPERTALAVAMRKLSLAQRLAVSALLNSATQSQALRVLADAGHPINRSTLYRWTKSKNFVAVWKMREASVAKLITRDTVMTNAQNLMDEAMKEQPIVQRRTGDIIGYKVEIGHALTANEQLGKAVGAFGNRDDGKTVIVIDIDFSGRKDPVREIQAEEADFTESSDLSQPDLSQPDLEQPENDDWLD